MKVRCPNCSWRPGGQAFWSCERCSCSFDTFATNARCPDCGKTWLETQCPSCSVWSLHEDWYDGEIPVYEVVEETRELER